ncbi:hypothetical protein M3N64_13695, partial [Sporolactobacillus sp. CPB3-1]
HHVLTLVRLLKKMSECLPSTIEMYIENKMTPILLPKLRTRFPIAIRKLGYAKPLAKAKP